MDGTAALRLAVSLVQVPSRVRQARTEPLPAGLELLLRVAAGDAEATQFAAEQTGRPAALLHEAATFYVEQILLAPGSDSYRVLGAAPDASLADLRRNMALLVRWIHPDVAEDDPRAVFAARITKAWEDVKTPARRRDYDAVRDSERLATAAPQSPPHRRTAVPPPRARPTGEGERNVEHGRSRQRPSTLQRLLGR
jgi:hypothetical protein